MHLPKVYVIIPAFKALLIVYRGSRRLSCWVVQPFHVREGKEMMKMIKPALALWVLLFSVSAVEAETTTEAAAPVDVAQADDGTVEFLIADSVIEALSKQCVAESKEDKVVAEELSNFMEICMAVKIEEQMDLAYEKAVAEAEATDN